MKFDEVAIVHDLQFAMGRSGNMTCYCIPRLTSALERIYQKHTWAYEYLRDRRSSKIRRGRKDVVEATVGSFRAIVKRFHHGGALGNLTRDRFASNKRMLEVMESTGFLASHGIPTPPVLFLTCRKTGPIYRGEMAVECIEGGIDASEFLFSEPPKALAQALATIETIGRLVARLHAAGFFHGDLNLMNFLVTSPDSVQLLDLDKSLRYPPPLKERLSTKNLARLTRSIFKQGHHSPVEYLETLEQTLLSSYRDAPCPG